MIEQIDVREASEGGRIRLGLGSGRALWVAQDGVELSARCEGATEALSIARVDSLHRLTVAPHLGAERFAVVWMDDESVSAAHVGCDGRVEHIKEVKVSPDHRLDSFDLLVAAVDVAGDLLIAVAVRHPLAELHMWRQAEGHLVPIPLAHNAIEDVQLGLACAASACRIAWTEQGRVETRTWGADGVEQAHQDAAGSVDHLALAPGEAGWRLGWSIGETIYVSTGSSGVAEGTYLLTEAPQGLALTPAPAPLQIAAVDPTDGLALYAPRADAPGELEVVARASAVTGRLAAVAAATSPARIRLTTVEGDRRVLYEAACR